MRSTEKFDIAVDCTKNIVVILIESLD